MTKCAGHGTNVESLTVSVTGDFMAGQERNLEGDNEQRGRKAREARRKGLQPSEVGATLGAGKQRKEAPRSESHQERMDTKAKGKRGAGTSGKPRPGSRNIDPKRTDRWA
ncbi:MAG TPA: hypothetical protein VK494_00220 [Gemmatimonadaceae bacterium]|nr:hypothetical protein [Gemmatimonadaceae bacterium]